MHYCTKASETGLVKPSQLTDEDAGALTKDTQGVKGRAGLRTRATELQAPGSSLPLPLSLDTRVSQHWLTVLHEGLLN